MSLRKLVSGAPFRRRIITVLIGVALAGVGGTSIRSALDARRLLDHLAAELDERSHRERALDVVAERYVSAGIRISQRQVFINVAVAGVAFILLGGLTGWTARRPLLRGTSMLR
jgi:hypothetical protein